MKADEARWAQKARRLCGIWAVNYKTTHLTFLKREGCRKGSKRSGPDVDWNAQLLEIAREWMEVYFRNFQEAMGPIFQDALNAVGVMIDNTKRTIQGSVRGTWFANCY